MKTKSLTVNAIVAAAYVVLTTALSSISFGPVQIRIAAAMYQLCAYSPKYFWGLAVGVVIANMFSPLGPIDLAFGVATTVIGLGVPILFFRYLKTKKTKMLAVSVGVTVATIFVATELHMVYDLPIMYTWLTVAAGQAITQIIGMPVFAAINARHDLRKMIQGADTHCD